MNAQPHATDELAEGLASCRPADEPVNIGVAACGRWAEDRSRFALYFEDEAGQRSAHTFWDIQREANRLANVLAALGTLRGDRVALLLPQCPEAAIAYIAIYQMGAICVPLSPELPPVALAYRLRDSSAHVAIVDAHAASTLHQVGDKLPHLRHRIGVGVPASHQVRSWADVIEHASPRYSAARTLAADPATIVYPQAASGHPSGALMAQAAVLGACTGYACALDCFPRLGDLVWAIGDWHPFGGWGDVLLPAWQVGVPVLAYRGRWEPRRILALLDKYAVRNAFFSADALRALRSEGAQMQLAHDLALRSAVCVGGPLDEETVAWCADSLCVPVGEVFLQTAAKYVLGKSAELARSKPGSMGRAYPGHRVTLLGPRGEAVPVGAIGEIAIQRQADGRQDFSIMCAYWQNPRATAAAVSENGWVRTGDFARADADGDLWPVSGSSGGPKGGISTMIGTPCVCGTR